MRLSHHELGCSGDLVRDGDHCRLQLVAPRRVPRRSRRQRCRQLRAPRRSCPGARRARRSRSPPHRGDARQHSRAARSRSADASGSSGSNITVPGPFALDASTPADAQTKPCCVRAITRGGRERTTSADSARITSISRGSPSLPASSIARGDGSTSRGERRDPPPSRRPSARRRRHHRPRSPHP